MNELNTFTSTGCKLIHHLDVVKKLKEESRATPVSIQVAPTSRCNLNCVFCSNINRSKHEDLDTDRLIAFMEEFRCLGTKTIEWTGGGDPTMYEGINAVIYKAARLGLKQGMITNGVALSKNVKPESLKRLAWLRISMNCLDYIHDDIDIPNINGTLGFSYVVNEKTDSVIFDRLKKYIDKFKPAYVRVVPNCQESDEEQKENNIVLSELVEELGPPFFYQPKIFKKPNACYWGYLKPFILHDGYVYPCSSVVLNQNADRSFHEKYRWVHMNNLSWMYRHAVAMSPFPTENCGHCVFEAQNDLVGSLIHPSGMEDFI